MKRIALLRGINVGGHRKVPMAILRERCAEAGFSGIRSYIQSGNLVFDAEGTRSELEGRLESLLLRHFGVEVPVIVRDAAQWRQLRDSLPFPEAAEQQPNLVMLGLAKRPMAPEMESLLKGKAERGERIRAVGEALWIHFPSGSGRSKITPALLDRAAGSPVTTRNVRTVRRVLDML